MNMPIKTSSSREARQQQADSLVGPKLTGTRLNPRQRLSGGKDLIIRMLAEVFQVNQSEDGQVRWQRVSSSLVPVSLYSRTTSKWLDYLLTASSMANSHTASAMSPDSRDFLLLLQQFHRQNRPPHLINRQEDMGLIVFQVVGHDFIDGQCKRILNIKLAQPGTRLGQASDYFVYWKEHQSCNHTLMHQSSLASGPHQLTPRTARYNFSGLSPMHVAGCCEPHTWGLNFASINDAKLFYDICSLNLVDLDFNSDYLKHLAFDDRQQRTTMYQQQQYNYGNAYPNALAGQQQILGTSSFDRQVFREMNAQQQRQNQQMTKIRNHHQQQQQQQQQQQYLCPTSMNIGERTSKRQVSNVKCPTCKQQANSRNRFGRNSDEDLLMSNQYREDSFVRQDSGAMRMRSRSTTRQPTNGSAESEALKRTRSFTALGSMDVIDSACPVHSGQAAKGMVELEADAENHHPRCLNFIRKQKDLLKKQSIESEGPRKPARGMLREALMAKQSGSQSGSGEQQQQQASGANISANQRQQAPSSSNQNFISSSELHSKRKPKARYTGHIRNLEQQLSASGYTSQFLRDSSGVRVADETGQGSSSETRDYQMDNQPVSSSRKCQFTSNRPAQRRSMGLDSHDAFEPLSSRDARLARARYANSKHMKEFLSLDASCVPLTPTRMLALQEKYQLQQQAKSMLKNEQQQQQQQLAKQVQQKQQQQQSSSAQQSRTKLVSHESGSGGEQKSRRQQSLEQRAQEGETVLLDEQQQQQHAWQASNQQDCEPSLTSRQIDAVHNVSTTTEDLPLDPNTRRRMFKLTSEEVISERTEPKSVSATSGDQNQLERRQVASDQVYSGEGEKSERQARAVSLGAGEAEAKLRGHSVRSDAGRRRSLERSMGVDLDCSSTLPINSSKKFNRCLSPMAQLGGPLVVDDVQAAACSLKGSPLQRIAEAGGNGDVMRHSELLVGGSKRAGAKRSQAMGPATTTTTPSATSTTAPKRARTKSTGDKYSGAEAYVGDNLEAITRGRGNEFWYPMSQEGHFGDAGGTCQQQQQHLRQQPKELKMASFKSAPDISQFVWGHQNFLDNQRAANESGEAIDIGHFNGNKNMAHCDMNYSPDMAADMMMMAPKATGTMTTSASMPKRTTTAGLSSYAVPLCLGDERDDDEQPYARKFHSCPNSLRRSRRAYHFDGQQQQQHYGDEYASHCQLCHGAHFERLAPDSDELQSYPTALDDCQFCSNQCGSSACGGPNCIANVMLTDRHRPHHHHQHQHHHQQHQRHQQQHQHSSYHHQQLHCHHHHQQPLVAPTHHHYQQHQHHHRAASCTGVNVGSEATLGPGDGHGRGFVARAMPLAPDYSSGQQQPAASMTLPAASGLHYRPHSSQSSRSPLHYGLYESEIEDDCIHHQDNCQQQVNCCSSTSQPFNRSLSVYSRQGFSTHSTATAALTTTTATPTTTTTPLKPVQGYDRTMARASLKSRQRARSQPPISDTENVFHLTKSMENVQKLIKEVQNELNSLRRQPASKHFFHQTPSKDQGLAPAESRSLDSGDRDTANNQKRSMLALQAETSSTKMSNEEQNQQTRYQIEDQQAVNNPKLSLTSATRRAGQFKCVGAIRKAGFLSVKKWILKRRQSIELARKQGWKRYWVCLRGTALLFHSVIDKKDDQEISANNQTDLLSWIQANCGGQMQIVTNLLQCESRQEDVSQDVFISKMSQCYIEKEPRHLIIIDGAIAQPIPEHPKRDNVFCLSTTFGDAYLFQAACQFESDNWISAIHNACAAAVARDLTRDEAIKLFETKIRHLELEAEKKLFLRQRLESRLTSMSSMSHIGNIMGSTNRDTIDMAAESLKGTDNSSKKVTMRALLQRLSMQLHTLDTYIEQVHCEVYQLRCYLSSCGAQQVFYQNMQRSTNTSSQTVLSIDLPHPKSLLIHVSKPTKLLLIKLGVFTVSSFHAYIHARQESAETILQKIQQTSQQSGDNSSPIELRIRSHSISETLLARNENVKLESDTEQLIQLSSLKSISLRVRKNLYHRIRHLSEDNQLNGSASNDADDRYTICDAGEFVIVDLKLHTSSNFTSIVKQVLNIIEPQSSAVEFLNYYLRSTTSQETSPNKPENSAHYVTRRKETIDDYSDFKQLELVEKIIFRIELSRCRMEEGSTPFGLSIEGQLFTNKFDSLLNVFCSYIEWGSVADKAGLKDEDELLMINGIPVADLDMMFVECIIQDESRLKLVVRSSREDNPSGSVLLDKTTWRPSDEDEDGYDPDLHQHLNQERSTLPHDSAINATSHVISDEYISSLVCPPPPSHSSAFLRTDLNLIRQKSDLGAKNQSDRDDEEIQKLDAELEVNRIFKAKSQHNLDNSISVANDYLSVEENHQDIYEQRTPSNIKSSADLAEQLIKKTEQLTHLLGKSPLETISITANSDQNLTPTNEKADSSYVTIERLRKSIIELLETEYAYIRHLETISEHYMNPLDGIAYLNISDLKQLSQIVVELTKFQKDFFDKLIGAISINYGIDVSNLNDEYGALNTILVQIEPYTNISDFKSILESITGIFLSEADRFKEYANYCIAYSRLQKLLHSRETNGMNLLTTITSVPATLNTFSYSAGISMSANMGGNMAQHRDFLRPLGSFRSGNSNRELNAQLKQLSEFLGNLDSSSSSVSLSLPKSSASDQTNSDHLQQKKTNKLSSNNSRATATPHKSVHQQNFESYLIKPIQRIVKYPMLLNSIAISAQVFNDEPFYKDLQCAIRQMESVISHVNDTQRLHDEYGCIFDLIERQYFEQHFAELAKINAPQSNTFGPHQPAICLNVNQILYSGPIEWLNKHDFTSKLKEGTNLTQVLFVFSSCVVFICKELVRPARKRTQNSNNLNSNGDHQSQLAAVNSSSSKAFNRSTNFNEQATEVIRYQTLIPVSEVQVRSVQSSSADLSSSSKSVAGNRRSSKGQEVYQWELFQCSSSNSNSSLLTKTNKRNNNGKVYLLASATNEDRNAFLRKIRFIIRESVRNMSLPLARSPSSKSFTPKKLSSPSSATNTNSSCSHTTSLSPVLTGSDVTKKMGPKEGVGDGEWQQEQQQQDEGVNFNYAGQVSSEYSSKAGIKVNN